MAWFCFYRVWKANKICCQTVLLCCGTMWCLLYHWASFRYQQGCTAYFTEKQRGWSILMALQQLVCKLYLPVDAGQNETTRFPTSLLLLFFPEMHTSCPSVQIFHPAYSHFLLFQPLDFIFYKILLVLNIMMAVYFLFLQQISFSSICSCSHFHQNF